MRTVIALATLLMSGASLEPVNAEIVYRGTPHAVTTQQSPPTPGSSPLRATRSSDRQAFEYGEEWLAGFDISGGQSPYSISLTSGTLPDGISLRIGSESLRLEGRTVSGVYGPLSFLIQDATETAAEGLSVSIPQISVGSPSTPFASAGTSSTVRFPKGAPWSLPISFSGGLSPYEFGTVDGGLRSEDGQGLIFSGNGAVVRTTIPVVTATDYAGATTRSSEIRVQVGEDAALVSTVDGALTGLDRANNVPSTRTATIRNDGDFATNVAPSPSISGPFRVTAQRRCTSVVPPKETCEVDIQTTATDTGNHQGSLSFAGSSLSIQLRGSVQAEPCGGIGKTCADGWVYAGRYSNKNYYVGPISPTQVSISSALNACPSGTRLPTQPEVANLRVMHDMDATGVWKWTSSKIGSDTYHTYMWNYTSITFSRHDYYSLRYRCVRVE